MGQYDLFVARGTSLAEPIAVSEYRKADPPRTGDKYGAWGVDPYITRLPGGSVMQFDLSRLTLEDYRMMKTDYQLNASLLMLQMMIAQSDWGIYTKGEDTDPKAKLQSTVLEEGIRRQWIPLVRALSQAFWAGYSPNVMVYELNNDKYYEVVKFKDLVPENAAVDWDEHVGADGLKIKTYSGILNAGKKIPGKNTLWYPLMMENGDYYGRKLLQPAFPPWFFSQLIHLYTNRYFERFGEPTAIGYYPGDETVTDSNGNQTSSREVMANILLNLRSRGVVTMPSDRDPETKDLEWDIKYLESQMRGADFDRYLARLDEEKSLALFTPVLMFRTGDAGSYNLGTLHSQVFQWMLNSIVGDIKTYLDEYLVKQLHDINFGPNAPRSEFRFRTLGRLHDEGAQSILLGLIQNGGAKVTEQGLRELGSHLGIELEYLTGEATPQQAPNLVAGPLEKQVGDILTGPDPSRLAARANAVPAGSARKQLTAAQRRLEEQVRGIFARKEGAEREYALGNVKLGYKGAFLNDMTQAGADPHAAENFFHTIEREIRSGITDARTESDAVSAIHNIYADYGLERE